MKQLGSSHQTGGSGGLPHHPPAPHVVLRASAASAAAADPLDSLLAMRQLLPHRRYTAGGSDAGKHFTTGRMRACCCPGTIKLESTLLSHAFWLFGCPNGICRCLLVRFLQARLLDWLPFLCCAVHACRFAPGQPGWRAAACSGILCCCLWPGVRA